jgi:membrane-bound serine protease (ClpP class)
VDVLLQRADGMSIPMQDGSTRVLRTAGATVIEEQMGVVQRFLNFITNPTIATLLITVGTAGLLAEVWNPGTWVPGVIGGICLLLGLYALGQLDANFAGLALMGIGLALFIAEAFTPSFGALLVAGLIAFGLGALLLFNDTGYRVPWEAIVPTAVALGAFAFFISGKGLAAQRAPSPVGASSLIGMTGYAKEELLSGLPGSVFVNGEWWTATLDAGSVQAGENVRVVGRRGITLLVTRI